MADKLEEWDPKTGTVKPKTGGGIRPGGGGGQGGSGGYSVPIGPGSSMKSNRPPSYKMGGIVGPNVQKWGSPKVSAPCKDTKTLTCK